MKKFFAMLLVLCMTLSLSALAESINAGPIDPFAAPAAAVAEDEAPAADAGLAGDVEAAEPVEAEAPAEVTVTAAAPAAEPEGTELYQYEFGTTPDWGKVMVSDVLVGETAQARDAAEDSLTIPAKPGNKVVDVRLTYNPAKDQPVDGAVAARIIVDGEALQSRLYIESESNGLISRGECGASNDSSFSRCDFGYLINPEGSLAEISNNWDTTFYLFDVIAQVPEAALAEGKPVYVQMTLGEKDFWCQVL